MTKVQIEKDYLAKAKSEGRNVLVVHARYLNKKQAITMEMTLTDIQLDSVVKKITKMKELKGESQ